MPEGVLLGGMVLVKAAATGSISDAVTSATGYTDLSETGQTFQINDTGEVSRLAPHGGKLRGRVYAGAKAGTVSFVFARKDGGTPDAAAFFEGIHATKSRRFQFVIQLDHAALESGGVVTPAASAANPQYAGSAVTTSVDPWGAGPGNLGLVRVEAELDDDYARYDS